MNLRFLVIIFGLVFLLGACGPSRPVSTDEPSPERYDEARAMTYFLDNPEYAMILIDSAYIDENISDLKRQYLKAIVMYNGFSHPDSSLLMLRHLVESEEWEEVEDTTLLVEVYGLMATVAGTMNRHADVIRYAQLASDLAHGHPDLSWSESDQLSRVGRTMAYYGQWDEGMQYMKRALQQVDNSRKWPDFLTYINVGRKIAVTLLEMKRPTEALQLLRIMISRLNHFKEHALEYEDLQMSMSSNPKAVDNYVNYNLVRCYSRMIRCFAAMEMPDSASYWIRKMQTYKESQDQLVMISLIPSLVRLHFDDMVLANQDALFKALGTDTLDMDYVRLLEALSELEQHRGNWKASNSYLIRASNVRDSVERENYRNQLTDQMTLYQLQDERYNRMDVEARNSRLVFVSTALSLFVFLMTMIGLALRLFKSMKTLQRVHNDTKSELQEAKQQIEKLSQGYVPETPEQLYGRIIQVMDTRRPYTDQNFDIAQLASMLHTNRTYISKVINRMSGLNFRSWLAKYRINLVQQYMKEYPNAGLDEICEVSGYASRSSLFRQFKAITGHTPIGWMASVEDSNEENVDEDEIVGNDENVEDEESDDNA